MRKLAQLGWNDAFAEHAKQFPDLEPARVALVFRGGYEVWGASGEFLAQVSGRFRHNARTRAENPVTGDFVMIETLPGEPKALIHAVLPRRTRISRTVPGRTTEEQILAANIDTVFIAASLSAELRLRTLERYLTVARDSGAIPVILLTKSDLCPDVPHALEQVHQIAGDTAVIPVSSVCELGLAEVRRLLPGGRAAVVLGPSGVGKSTLINALIGEEALPTIAVREDDQKGRHTTTERQMVPLPRGGLIIDTPGLREIQLWEGQEGLLDAFPEITTLAADCKFNDCSHESEPGCAVVGALLRGELAQERLSSFKKLQREITHFEALHSVRVREEVRKQSKKLSKGLRLRLREKGREGGEHG